jgi:hypothetical protein
MLCKICNEINEGGKTVICSGCVQIMSNWTFEEAAIILLNLAKRLEKTKDKTKRKQIKDKIKWIEKFKGMKRKDKNT